MVVAAGAVRIVSVYNRSRYNIHDEDVRHKSAATLNTTYRVCGYYQSVDLTDALVPERM
jgi:hypothetical protein